LSIDDAQAVVQNAIGGDNVTTTVEGRERYPVNVQIPLAQLAVVRVAAGPAMIRNEDGLLTGYVYVDLAGRDPGGYVEEAGRLLRDEVKLPPGYAIAWSGQYEAIQRIERRLALVVPLTLFLIFLLLYLSTRSVTKTFIVLLAVPFSAVGAVWFVHLLGYNLSVGVWAGLIALLGVDAATGVFMLLYLDLAYEQAKREGRLRSLPELQQAILQGAVKRLRPKLMTVACMFLGLVPVLWAVGTGSDVMKRIAAPMVGGLCSSTFLTLELIPVVYTFWRQRQLRGETIAPPWAGRTRALPASAGRSERGRLRSSVNRR